MNRLLAVSVAACLMPAVAGAGEVFGTIKGAGGPVGGAEVTAKCGANA